MNELFKIDMDKREIVLNYKHYNVNVDILNYIVDLLKQLEAYENMRKELIQEFNFYETTEWGIKGYEILEKFRNILNKVGSDK